MLGWIQRVREKRWAHLAVVNLRILLGFAFLPAGLKKVLGEPFTDPANTGPFHEFLHAFHGTGFFYPFVGGMQLLVAALLMTQSFAPLGALIALPIFLAITVFCWSTQVVITASMVTLMLLGIVGLSIWDVDRWRAILVPVGTGPWQPPSIDERILPIDLALWRRSGGAIFLHYLGACALSGGVYRPRGLEWGEPAFYILPLVAVVPVITLVVELRRAEPVRR